MGWNSHSAQITQPHALFENRPELAIRCDSLIDLVAYFDSFLDLAFQETEIAGTAQRAAQRQRLATAEAAVAVAPGDNPAMPIDLPPATVPQTGIPSWVQPPALRLLVCDADQWEALGESGKVEVVSFPSENIVFSEGKNLAHGI